MRIVGAVGGAPSKYYSKSSSDHPEYYQYLVILQMYAWNFELKG